MPRIRLIADGVAQYDAASKKLWAKKGDTYDVPLTTFISHRLGTFFEIVEPEVPVVKVESLPQEEYPVKPKRRTRKKK